MNNETAPANYRHFYLFSGRGIRDNGLYLNVGIVSCSAAENIKPTTVPITRDNEYYNLSEVQSSCIRVEELKQYIEKKQRQEELKNEYKVQM